MDNNTSTLSKTALSPLTAAILNSLHAHVAILDEYGHITAHNEEWKLYRQQHQQNWSHPPLNSSMLDSLQPALAEGNDFALSLLLGIKEVLNEEKTSFITEYHPAEIGSTAFRVTVNSLENEGGAVLIYEDISTQVQQHRYLKETQDKFRHHFENSLYGIVVTDENHSIIEANHIACSLLETTLDGLLSSNLTRHLPVVSSTEELQRKINRSGSYLGEFELTTTAENSIPIELNVTLFRNEFGETLTSWAFKDISSKKMMQQQLLEEKEFTDSAISSLPNAFFVFNLDGKLIRWNNMLEQDLGYTHDEIARMNVLEFVHPGDLNLVENALNGDFLGQKVSLEARCIAKDGHTVHYLITGSSFEQNGKHFIVGGGLNRNDVVEIKHEKQLVHKELQRTQTFNELAVEGANIGLWELDLVTGETYFNERWYRMLGYSDKEIEFTRDFFSSLLHPADVDIPQKELDRYLIERDQYEVELRMRTKDGSYKWILAAAKFTEFDKEGIPVRLSGSHLDITARKTADLEIKKKQTLLNQLFDNSPIGIVRIDTEGHIQKINDGFKKIFGYTEDEILGKKLLNTITPPEMIEHSEQLAQLLFKGESYQTETRRMNKAGEEIPILLSGIPVIVDGEVIAIYGMYVDISERKALENEVLGLLEIEKKARAQMESLFEESPSAIALLEGTDHTFTFVNDKHKVMVGERDLVGRTVCEALPELAEQGFIKLLNDCYENDTACYYSEKEIYFQNAPNEAKTIHYLNFVYKPIHDKNDNVYGIFVEAIDVTEQVEARKTIEKSLVEKETLLSEVHHRVKNNLAIISGLLELEILDNTDLQLTKHLHTTQSRISTIAKIHELLYQNESLSHVNFKQYILNVINDKNLHANQCSFHLASESDLKELFLNVNQAIPLGMLLNEILDYTEHLKTVYNDHNDCLLSLKLVNGNDGFATLEIQDESGKLLQYYCDDDAPNTALRKELINVLTLQIDGEISLQDKPVPTLSIHFEKKELMGPHSALK